MSERKRMTTIELIEEFEWTRCRHGGLLSIACRIFEVKPATLARRFERAKAAGIHVDYQDDTKRVRS